MPCDYLIDVCQSAYVLGRDSMIPINDLVRMGIFNTDEVDSSGGSGVEPCPAPPTLRAGNSAGRPPPPYTGRVVRPGITLFSLDFLLELQSHFSRSTGGL